MKTTKGLVRKQATSDRASRLLNILQVSLSAHFTARSVRERTARSTQRLFDGIDGGSPQCRLWAARSRLLLATVSNTARGRPMPKRRS